MKYILLSVVLFLTNILVSFFLIENCIENRGVAFGIEIEYVSLIKFFLLIFVLLLSFKIEGNLKNIFLSIVILGSGNLFERIVRGYVCDYIPFFNLSINIVDIGIVVVTIAGVLICIFKKNEDTNKGR